MSLGCVASQRKGLITRARCAGTCLLGRFAAPGGNLDSGAGRSRHGRGVLSRSVMRTAAALTVAASAVASALAGTRRSHAASGRAPMRRLGAPQRRTRVLGQQGRRAMNTRTVRTRFVLVLAPLVLAAFGATSSALACVVGTGMSASCTETGPNGLDACLAVGGTVTFNCGGAATI